MGLNSNYSYNDIDIRYNVNADGTGGLAKDTGNVHNHIDGADLMAVQIKNRSQWTTISNWYNEGYILPWDFEGFDSIWVWDDTGKKMPSLRSVGITQDWPEWLVDYLGSGTPEDPFIVYDVETLNRVGKGVGEYISWNLSAHYIMISDVILPVVAVGESNFFRVGTILNAFTGSFNGQGYTITNLTINANSDYLGMFASVAAVGVVKDLGLINVNVSGNSHAASIVGLNNGTILNCYTIGSVTGNSQIGGMIGENTGTVLNCYFIGNVTSSSFGSARTGGIVGVNSGVISNCYFDGNVNGSSNVGGVAGENHNIISNCYFKGNVTGPSGNTGGIVGENTATVTNCFSTSNVTGGYSVGGIAGNNTGTGTVTNCFSTSNVTGGWVGGIVGENTGTVANCITLCLVVTTTSTNFNNLGRMVGGWNTLGTRNSNYAWSEIDIRHGVSADGSGGTVKETGNALDHVDGFGLTVTQVKTQSQWTTASNWHNNVSTIVPWNFTAGTGVWIWDTTGQKMPSLRGVGEAQDWPEWLVNRGDGTPTNPFHVYDSATLNRVGKGLGAYAAWNLSAHYIMTADITLDIPTAGEVNFTGIGSGSGVNAFSGSFDGQGFSITNLTIDGSGNPYYHGMFRYIESGTIRNLKLVNVNINGGHTTGSIAGHNSGNITNCHVTGNVVGPYNGGGIVGFNQGTVTNCSFSGNMSGDSQNIGGVVGVNSGTVSNCFSYGSVSGAFGVGGIAGTNSNLVSNSYSSSSIIGFGHVGGVAGGNSGIVVNCMAINQRVLNMGADTSGFGRVTGNNTGTLTNNYAWSGIIIRHDVAADGSGGSDKTSLGNALNHEDGSTQSASSIKGSYLWTTAICWNQTAPNIAWDFAGASGIWIWDDAKMPTLRGIGSAQDWPAWLN